MIRGSFPQTRMRRNRLDEFTRKLVREHCISADDLIYPLFVQEGRNTEHNIQSMPGIKRYSLDMLLNEIAKAQALGIHVFALFPMIESSLKSHEGQEAHNPKGLIPRVINEVKKRFPDIGIIADVALDPYTLSGQDGIVDQDGYVVNDKTSEALCLQAQCLAGAGADILAPSDMMDGRIGAIRTHLDREQFINVKLLSYAVKYASHFYGPFRDAVGSKSNLGKADKRNYQMDPANGDEALHEAALDLSEGADWIMVKPGMPYLDVIRRLKLKYKVPTLAYQVSGEYSMLKAAFTQGWLEEAPCLLEVMTCFKRAGADAVLTYFAPVIADLLRRRSGSTA